MSLFNCQLEPTRLHSHDSNGMIWCVLLFMLLPLSAGGIMFSGCPSVSPRPEIPSFHLYMRPLVQPWPFYGQSVRPPGDVSWHFPENAWRDWPQILHANLSWPSSELIRLWSRSISFFGVTLTYWNGSNLGFLGIFRRTHGGNGLKMYMLMYPDHLQNDDILVVLSWFSTLWCPFDLLKLVIFGVFRCYPEKACEQISRGERMHISDTLRQVMSSFCEIIIHRLPVYRTLKLVCLHSYSYMYMMTPIQFEREVFQKNSLET